MAIILFGLAIGIYKKSRACAGIVLLYYVLATIQIIVQQGRPSSWLFGLVFIYFYLMAFVATVAHHKANKSNIENEM